MQVPAALATTSSSPRLQPFRCAIVRALYTHGDHQVSTTVAPTAESDLARSRTGPIFRGLITVLTLLIIWFSPMPNGVEQRAWHLFAIFFGTIIGLILQPVPMGAVVLIGTTVTMLTGSLTFNEEMDV